MKKYMLDTNTVSHIFRNHGNVMAQLMQKPLHALCISSITEGELLYGLAKRPHAKKLHHAVSEFLHRVDVLPWDSEVAALYGKVRANMERCGKDMGALDLLIGAHAMQAGATLVTNDKAFKSMQALEVEDWTL